MDKLTNTGNTCILVTGSNGFLGQKLVDKLTFEGGYTVVATSKGPNRNPNKEGYTFVQGDLNEEGLLSSLLAMYTPTHIIHTAAMTSVEACEKNRELCEATNVTLVKRLASCCLENNIHLTFLSTDFVFDGKAGPYREEDTPNPCNNYGQSKLAAEQAIWASGCQAAILRTILVYGHIQDPSRSNFVSWVREKLSSAQTITVVKDQWRMPTWVDDLADACIIAASKKAKGTYHISGDTLMSILEIALEVAAYWELDKRYIKPIAADEIGQGENRPRKTGFIIRKATDELGFRPTPLALSFRAIEKQLA
ncbi:SDR family oxidoreductase [Sphingobacterium griseoflavum]|uniref:dTDP-4-dehydrorhamnose reductase n=1 Tax=Sphingobacterium griseoflavum TaxID=1474952 RepID=A0ABQ3HW06_9SPHI|nr:SDR family oxidoreductase [Sphingobacterium griseoflavum]GHE23667.1 NAD(P)-dependent oxidoreductase [Sphingobacterium griseoflavum]